MTPRGSIPRQIPGHGTPGVQHNILAAAASGVADFITRQGGHPDDVFTSVGVEEKALGQPNVALDLRAYVAMMEVAARDTGNDNFGLLFGRQFTPEMLGLIGSIALAAPTLISVHGEAPGKVGSGARSAWPAVPCAHAPRRMRSARVADMATS